LTDCNTQNIFYGLIVIENKTNFNDLIILKFFAFQNKLLDKYEAKNLFWNLQMLTNSI